MPPPRNLPDPGIEPTSSKSPALVGSLLLVPPGKPKDIECTHSLKKKKKNYRTGKLSPVRPLENIAEDWQVVYPQGNRYQHTPAMCQVQVHSVADKKSHQLDTVSRKESAGTTVSSLETQLGISEPSASYPSIPKM